MEKLTQKWTAPLVVAALGLVLFLPLLGSFGLWEPHEVRIADVAKDVLAAPGGVVPSKVAMQRPHWLVVQGFKRLSTSEWGGRLPIALASILALLACYYAGDGVLRRRGALLGAVALATSPAFFLGARQLTSDAGPILAFTLAVGGLARVLWPKPEAPIVSTLVHFVVGVVGLVLGYFASGVMIGVAAPLTAVALASLCAGGPIASWAPALTVGAVAWGVVVWAWRRFLPGGGHGADYSPILAGMPRVGVHAVQLVTVLKQIGFGAFPWVTLLPLATARAFAAAEPEAAPIAVGGPEASLPFRAGGSVTDVRPARGPSRERYGQLVLFAWLAVGYLACTAQAWAVGDVAFAALPAVALLAGAFLDEVMDDERAHLGLAGLIVALGAATVAHDYFLNPETLAGAHVIEGIKWPSPLVWEPFLMLGLALGWGVLAGVALALRPSKSLLGRQGVTLATVGAALLFTLTTTFWIIPEVSKHLSFKNVFAAYQKLGGDNAELAQYRVPSHPWGERKATDLQTLPQLFDFLGKPVRVFALVGAEELAPIDQYAKSQPGSDGGRTYYVVDDSNVHFLLLSNRLGANETDHNPLKRFIVKSLPQQPQHEVHADLEGKVELVGYDLPPELDRGRKFKITLYYKVNAPIAGTYKIFVHFDGPGTRFNADHVPLTGKFPTNYWVPGYYIIDEFEAEPDRATAPAGYYQIYSGMWLGDARLKVASGAQDGENRVKLGAVKVK
jgi:4-amino-4-deoxy-L-arabinose transferase-like glycosyltransferase